MRKGKYKEHYQKNREGFLDRARKFYKENKDTVNARNKKHRTERRLAVMTHYSQEKMECACCGERTYQFLTLDHVNGGGTDERKKVGSGSAFYWWIIKNNFPTGYQVLCHNCNMAKGLYGNCPHKL